APMVVGGSPPVRVGRRQANRLKSSSLGVALFLFKNVSKLKTKLRPVAEYGLIWMRSVMPLFNIKKIRHLGMII
ncbi:hypothetical protein, partial [Rossellomorea sp. YZS02]|uniref:hypothetical protein n=1 Tax=Rossellomorea sp. YZS02 TaxID=3097358 RepID=UPI002A146248